MNRILVLILFCVIIIGSSCSKYRENNGESDYKTEGSIDELMKLQMAKPGLTPMMKAPLIYKPRLKTKFRQMIRNLKMLRK